MKIKSKKARVFKKKMKKFLTISMGVLGIIGFMGSEIKASWLDTWYDNVMSTSTGINYFEGQKRGYATFGSFSLRLPARTDYLFSIEKPHLKVGCGGIDLFMGGFSFLNPEYLVQKVQAMLQSAPFIAFDMALETLCPTCSEILKKTESIIDALNQIQLSECGLYVPKTVVDMAKNPSGLFQTQAEQSASIAQNKGFSDLWTKFWNKYVHKTDNDVQIEGVSASEKWRGVSDRLKDWLLNASDSQGYIEYLASKEIVDQDIAEIFRAYVGDLYKASNSDKTLINVEYRKVCAEADPSRIFDADPELWKLPVGSTSCVTEKVSNVQNKIIATITGAYYKVLDKQDLPSEYLTLVQVSPIPIHLYVKSAVLMRSSSILYTIAPDVAKGILYAGMLDLSSKMEGVLNQLSYTVTFTSSNSADSSGKEIQAKLVTEINDKVLQAKRDFDSRIVSLYRSVIGDIHKSIDVAMLVAQFESMVRAKLGDKYTGIISGLEAGRR